MAISNKHGHILLNTSNKSEAAVGYGTLYGDMAGSISVIGDVYKTQAYQLANYINRDREIIPVNTIVKPPSAELRPDQKGLRFTTAIRCIRFDFVSADRKGKIGQRVGEIRF